MTLADDIRADRETGTPGPWGCSKAIEVWVMAGTLHVATIPRAQDGDWSPANAHRIARLPDLEAAYLTLLAEHEALKERADALAGAAWDEVEAFCVLEDSGQIGARRRLEAALAAYEKEAG